ncbi:hypothetical protein CC78DRAFT_580682 [Lojkania enalia]|uniref:Uncharacterized protein n=1 Tax=Lojkania enalia TaxID=147567 RepID=A0A9P4KCX0_9PLEO|nr:hypothetical protein CC78DRAFT_580682 [Didymosphaeria enalia]
MRLIVILHPSRLMYSPHSLSAGQKQLPSHGLAHIPAGMGVGEDKQPSSNHVQQCLAPSHIPQARVVLRRSVHRLSEGDSASKRETRTRRTPTLDRKAPRRQSLQACCLGTKAPCHALSETDHANAVILGWSVFLAYRERLTLAPAKDARRRGFETAVCVGFVGTMPVAGGQLDVPREKTDMHSRLSFEHRLATARIMEAIARRDAGRKPRPTQVATSIGHRNGGAVGKSGYTRDQRSSKFDRKVLHYKAKKEYFVHCPGVEPEPFARRIRRWKANILPLDQQCLI